MLFSSTTKKALIRGGFIEEVVENRLILMKKSDFWFTAYRSIRGIFFSQFGEVLNRLK